MNMPNFQQNAFINAHMQSFNMQKKNRNDYLQGSISRHEQTTCEQNKPCHINDLKTQKLSNEKT